MAAPRGALAEAGAALADTILPMLTSRKTFKDQAMNPTTHVPRVVFLPRLLSAAALALCAGGPAAHAQAVDVLFGVSSSISDFSLNPNESDMGSSDSHVGAGTVLLPVNLGVTDAFGGGNTSVSAVGQMGVMHCTSQAGYAYVIRSATTGGAASTTSHFDFDDFVTVTSPTLPTGTVVAINVSLLLSGGVSVPAAGQARPGITANNNAYMRATSPIDDQLLSESNPATAVHDLVAVLQARVGDRFTFRYGIQTLTTLASDIPDYRSVSCDYSGRAVVSAQNPGVILTSGSGYAYVAPCYANCDGSTAAPILNANDFQCFLNAFASGSSYANCDGSTGVPVLNANDFQCFLNAYAAGCP